VRYSQEEWDFIIADVRRAEEKQREEAMEPKSSRAIPDDVQELLSQLMNLPVWKFEILRREMAELLCDDEMGDEY
jgi:hypothetical protein